MANDVPPIQSSLRFRVPGITTKNLSIVIVGLVAIVAIWKAKQEEAANKVAEKMNATAAIIGVLLTCCVLSVFYWHIVRETAVIAIRFRLFARRDLLRRLALDRKEDHRSFAYRELEEFICKTIAVVPSISLASLIVSMLRNRNPSSEDLDRFRNEASEELSELLHLTVKDAFSIMALNSPILVTVGAFIALLLWIIGRFNKMFLYRQTEHFVDELPTESDEPLPLAA